MVVKPERVTSSHCTEIEPWVERQDVELSAKCLCSGRHLGWGEDEDKESVHVMHSEIFSVKHCGSHAHSRLTVSC